MVEESDKRSRSRSRSPCLAPDENTWKCENCGKTQALDHDKCTKCRLARGESKTSLFKEDWECGTCRANNFSRRIDCFKCHARKPPADPKHPNDWTCSSCRGNNFSRRVDCYKCGEAKPRYISSQAQGRIGMIGDDSGHPTKQDDWFCGSCDGHNFSRRLDCYKCRAPKPRPPAPARYGYLDRPPVSGNTGRSGGLSRMRSPTPERGYRQRSPIRGGGPGGGPGAPDVDPITGEMEWTCPVCGVPNFYKRFDCYRCYERKPEPDQPRDELRWNSRPQGGASSYDTYPPPARSLSVPDRGPSYNVTSSPSYNVTSSQNYYKPAAAWKPEPKKKYASDWICSDRDCQGMNFSKRTDCYKCHLPRPSDNSKSTEIAKNDWECHQCGGNNYSRRVTCYRCSNPKPEVDA